jgi:hypothetical protein
MPRESAWGSIRALGSRRECRSITPFPRREAVDTGLLVVKEDEAPRVPVIFDLYTNKRMGSRAVAQWLNRRGHRTKSGRPWGHTAVLTVLSNRAYVGEIFFRSRYHPAPHPRLVEAKVFETAHAILESRGEDMALRRTNGSDYLLTGLLVCEKCGKHSIGASAQEKAYLHPDRQLSPMAPMAPRFLPDWALGEGPRLPSDAVGVRRHDRSSLRPDREGAAAGQAVVRKPSAPRGRRSSPKLTIGPRYDLSVKHPLCARQEMWKSCCSPSP